MNCPACGAENRESAHFCRICGEPLAEALSADIAAEEGAPSGAPVEAPPEAPTQEPGPATEEQIEPVAEPPPPAEEEVPPPAEPPSAAKEGEGPPEEALPLVKEEAPPPEEAAPAPVRPVEEAEEPPSPLAWDEEAEEGEPLPEAEDDILAFWREEREPLAVVAPGAMIADRYVIVEALDVQDDEILYRAQDLGRCWQCSYEGNEPDDTFCAQCGAALDRKPEARLLQVRDDEAEPSGGEPVAARLTHEDRAFLLLAEPEPEPEAQAPPPPLSLRLIVGHRSDAGQVRELNEDSLLVLTLAPTYESRTGPVLGFFAVADGMGGHEGGEVASKMALQVLTDNLARTVLLPELAGELTQDGEVIVRLRQAAIAANDAVFLARQKSGNDMGTTLTAAYIRDDRLFLVHVGDCRAYRWDADGLTQLTTDHSVVASMIAKGQAAPEEIYTHPHRSIIYRCIGDKPLVEVEADALPLAPGDRLVLCSDGLWEMVRSQGIEDAMMQEADPQTACDLLVNQANAAGGEDNISVIVVQVAAT